MSQSLGRAALLHSAADALAYRVLTEIKPEVFHSR